MPWARTRGGAALLVVAAVLLVLGALTGRGDVAVLGVPVLLAGVRATARRPAGEVRARVLAAQPDGARTGGPASGGAAARPAADGAGSQGSPPGALAAVVRLEAPFGTVAALVRVQRESGVRARALVALTDARDLPLRVRTVRTGPQQVATARAQGAGADLFTVSDWSAPASGTATVLPATTPLRELPSARRLRGLVGPHGSRRPGEGGDLRDVHPFTPGDRLRRIDWRVTARRAPDLHELYVRREHGQAEAVVVLVVDSRDDVGPDPRTWRGADRPDPADRTSLDLARLHAASLARAWLEIGDRVGLEDLAARRRPLPPGAGRRQLERIRYALALTQPYGDPAGLLRPPRLPAGALVVLLSTFLDDEPARVAAAWRALGHRVLAVDVLPALRPVRGRTVRDDLALRTVLLARTDRLADLADADVPVLAAPTAGARLAVAMAATARADRVHGRLR